MKELVDSIKKAVNNLEQCDLFESGYGELTGVCKRFLEKQGYKVIKSHYTYPKIEKSSDLIDLFDALFVRYHPGLAVPFRRKGVARAIAKRFVEARMESTDLTKEQALVECGEIINTVFKYNVEFNFTMPLHFGIFGQENCGWITDKAVQIMNRKKDLESMIRSKKAQDACIKEYIKIHGEEGIGFDIDKIIENMEKSKEKNFNGEEKEEENSS